MKIIIEIYEPWEIEIKHTLDMLHVLLVEVQFRVSFACIFNTNYTEETTGQYTVANCIAATAGGLIKQIVT